MKTPFFSIIIPTYNRADMISKAIDSVIGQSFSDWELIIVDDGGSDHTRSVVDGFKDHRIQYHWQENRELNGARNTGIRLSVGHFIGFLDDDDLLAPNHLQLHHQTIKRYNDCLVFKSGTIVVDRSGAKRNLSFYNKDIENPIQYIFREQMGIHSFSFHRSVFDTLSFDERWKLYDDDHFLIQAFLKFSLVQIPNYTAIYHKHDHNRTLRYDSESKFSNYLDAFDHAMESNRNELHKYISSTDIDRLRIKICMGRAIRLVQSGFVIKGWNFFLKHISISFLSQNPIYILSMMKNTFKGFWK